MNSKYGRRDGKGDGNEKLPFLVPSLLSFCIGIVLHIILLLIMSLVAMNLANPSAFLLPAGICVSLLSAVGCGISAALTSRDKAAVTGIIAEIFAVAVFLLLRLIFGRGKDSVGCPTDIILYLAMVGMSFLGTVIGAGIADGKKKRRPKLKR